MLQCGVMMVKMLDWRVADSNLDHYAIMQQLWLFTQAAKFATSKTVAMFSNREDNCRRDKK